MEVVAMVTVGCNKHEYLLSSTSHEEYSDDEVAVEFITHDALSRSISPEEYSDDEISTKKAMHWRLGPADHCDTIPYTGNLNHSVAVHFDFDNTVLYDFDMDRDTQEEEMVKSAEDEVSCRAHRYRFCSMDRPSVG
ncbi:uncharacterized protein LOC109882015 isoform X3 [Oncorhynchus kisutch]|uniref:uncharacterized protein LOC109882015 isoform X3 n=1 Tax=Oncorhynchus kisutch TaxID=8019 RepID=UPI0009A05261|nr:uncharacterized protein LOC109882015 isoform X3 [Oncorhynchus kisutch]